MARADEKVIKFKNVKNQLEFPVYITADFESVLVPVCEYNSSGKARIVQRHKPCGYAYTVSSAMIPELNKKTKVCIMYFDLQLH